MASHKSALKRIKQTHKREVLNRMHRTTLRHQMRKLREAMRELGMAGSPIDAGAPNPEAAPLSAPASEERGA